MSANNSTTEAAADTTAKHMTPAQYSDCLLQRGVWKAVQDKASNRTYFFNIATKERVWNLIAHVDKHKLHTLVDEQGNALLSSSSSAAAVRRSPPPPARSPNAAAGGVSADVSSSREVKSNDASSASSSHTTTTTAGGEKTTAKPQAPSYSHTTTSNDNSQAISTASMDQISSPSLSGAVGAAAARSSTAAPTSTTTPAATVVRPQPSAASASTITTTKGKDTDNTAKSLLLSSAQTTSSCRLKALSFVTREEVVRAMIPNKESGGVRNSKNSGTIGTTTTVSTTPTPSSNESNGGGHGRAAYAKELSNLLLWLAAQPALSASVMTTTHDASSSRFVTFGCFHERSGRDGNSNNPTHSLLSWGRRGCFSLHSESSLSLSQQQSAAATITPITNEVGRAAATGAASAASASFDISGPILIVDDVRQSGLVGLLSSHSVLTTTGAVSGGGGEMLKHNAASSAPSPSVIAAARHTNDIVKVHEKDKRPAAALTSTGCDGDNGAVVRFEGAFWVLTPSSHGLPWSLMRFDMDMDEKAMTVPPRVSVQQQLQVERMNMSVGCCRVTLASRLPASLRYQWDAALPICVRSLLSLSAANAAAHESERKKRRGDPSSNSSEEVERSAALSANSCGGGGVKKSTVLLNAMLHEARVEYHHQRLGENAMAEEGSEALCTSTAWTPSQQQQNFLRGVRGGGVGRPPSSSSPADVLQQGQSAYHHLHSPVPNAPPPSSSPFESLRRLYDKALHVDRRGSGRATDVVGVTPKSAARGAKTVSGSPARLFSTATRDYHTDVSTPSRRQSSVIGRNRGPPPRQLQQAIRETHNNKQHKFTSSPPSSRVVRDDATFQSIMSVLDDLESSL